MSFLGALADIGAVGGGFARSFDPRQIDQRAGDTAFGRSLMLLKSLPGSPLAQMSGAAPQQMAPGQPSVPMQPSFSPAVGGALSSASAASGVPLPILSAVARQESSGNPAAPHGGLMQIADATARQPGYGVPPTTPQALRDPNANALFAARYIAARNPGVDWSNPQAAAAALARTYNAGGDPAYAQHILRYLQGGAGGATPAQPGQTQGGQPPLNLQSVIQLVRQANPGANPRTIAMGVERWLPMLRVSDQQMWRDMMLQQRQQFEQGRNQRAQASLGERQSEFGTREKRLEASLQLREQQARQNYDLKQAAAKVAREKMLNAKSQADFKQKQTIYQDKLREAEAAQKEYNNTVQNRERAYTFGQPAPEIQPLVQSEAVRGAAAQKRAGAAQAAAQAARPTAQPAAQPALKPTPPVGTIENGYRFKGGDASKQENWEKL